MADKREEYIQLAKEILSLVGEDENGEKKGKTSETGSFVEYVNPSTIKTREEWQHSPFLSCFFYLFNMLPYILISSLFVIFINNKSERTVNTVNNVASAAAIP